MERSKIRVADRFLRHVLEELNLTCVTLWSAETPALAVVQHAGISEAERREYLTRWVRRDPWVKKRRFNTHAPGKFICSQEIVPDTELTRDECWREFMEPRGMHYGGGAVLAHNCQQTSLLTLFRATRFGPFAASEVEWCEWLIAHLMRAAALARRVRFSETERDTLARHFERMGVGMVVATRRGEILRCNAVAQSIFAARDGIGRSDGRVEATRADDQRRLAAALRQACAGRPVRFTISRRGFSPLLVSVTSRNGPEVVLTIVDPMFRCAVDTQPLEKLFGLTRAEAALCVDLVRGWAVKEIADRRGVSSATIRTHLSRALNKTGVRRQAELVALVQRIGLMAADGPDVWLS